MFKFSLRLCIWLALLVGSVLGLVLEREPWVLEKTRYASEYMERIWAEKIKLNPEFDRNRTPDGTRYCKSDWGIEFIEDQLTHERIFEFHFGMRFVGFVDNDTIILEQPEKRPNEEWPHFFLHRRFPEWWWGIFYRPLFWIAVVVFFGATFEFVSMRKRLRTG